MLLILGGSTVGAIIIGFLYGKSNRIWCKYLCPVTGVFALLSRLAPVHFQADQERWNRYLGPKTTSNCPVLLPLKTMQGSANCLMCGKCNNFRNAIELKALLLALATLWSMVLAIKIIKQYTSSLWRRAGSLICVFCALLMIDYFWLLMLHVWTIKADGLPWYTLWVPFK